MSRDPVWVREYYRSDGTFVSAHSRSWPSYDSQSAASKVGCTPVLLIYGFLLKIALNFPWQCGVGVALGIVVCATCVIRKRKKLLAGADLSHDSDLTSPYSSLVPESIWDYWATRILLAIAGLLLFIGLPVVIGVVRGGILWAILEGIRDM